MANEKITVASLDIKTEKLIASLEKTEGAVKSLIDRQKELEKQGEYNSKEYEENSKKIDSLTKSHETQTKALGESVKGTKKGNDASKAAKAAADNQSKAVGGLKAEILEATGLTGIYEKVQRAWAASTNASTVATNAATKATKLWKVALISTGIGAVVVALGLMVTYLASTQEGMDMVTSVTRPLGQVMQSLFGTVQKLGGAIFKLLSGDWDGFKDGLVDAGEALGDSFGKAYERGKEIDKLTKELEKSEGEFIIKKEELNRIYEEQKKKSDDINLSEKERIEAAKAANDAQVAIGNLMETRIDQEIELLQLKQKANDTSDAEKTELAKLIAERDKIRAEEAGKTTETQNKINSIRKESADKAIAIAKEAADARLRQMDAELALFIQQQGFMVKSREDQLNIDKSIADKEIAILDEQLKQKKITQTEYEAQVLAIKNGYAAQVAEATVQNAADELQVWKDTVQGKLDSEKFLTDALLAEQLKRNEAAALKEKEFLDLQLAQGVIGREAYNKAIADVDTEQQKKDDEVKATREQAQKDKEIVDLENKRAVRETNFLDELNAESVRMEQKRLQEVANAEKTGADISLINQKYAAVQKDIETDKTEFKMNAAIDTFNNLATILGKESAAGKAAAIASTTIATYQSATSAYAAMAGIPVVGPALGAIAAAAAVVSGLSTVKSIMSQKEPAMPAKESNKRYALGGILKGPRHRSGGIPTEFGELEGGESVMTRKATAQFGPLLSELNYSAGGRRFQQGGVLGSVGVGKGNASIIDYNALANTLQNNLSMVVSVEEISKVSNRVNAIERASRL